MDIAKMSIMLNQIQVQQQASLSVMKMAMGNVQGNGEAIQQLLKTSDVVEIQDATHPYLGERFDMKL